MLSAIFNFEFQFHKGTIKTVQGLRNEFEKRHFNSIKVQLKPFSDGFTPAQPLFQFHKGTIKTGKIETRLPSSTEFQFHKGTIKTLSTIFAILNRDNNFNSIKVQLKPAGFALYCKLPLFQFHKGTIKTIPNLAKTCANSYFNSIKVQLKLFAESIHTFFLTFQFHKGTIKTVAEFKRVLPKHISIP